jgi:predicted MPP superfamily phosphohydrolase
MSLFEPFMKPFDNNLTIKHYNIPTRKLSADKSARIVLISDLHSNLYDKKKNKISKTAEEQKPDIIVLPGDIADAEKPIDGAVQFVREIQGIAPVYYVTGNHECGSNKYTEIISAFQNSRVNILAGRYEEVTVNGVDLIIGGTDDPEITRDEPETDWNKQLVDNFAGLRDKPQYKILLSHRPELVNLYKKTYFDMVLSGHAHGGQVRIPYLLNGLFAPGQGLFPKYAGGLYHYSDITHIVSRGVSYDPRIPRVYNPPELVVIDIFPLG